eukprot:m.234579 g.234579  ORF g.234579 m.234579 type:complete len:2885 (+) comp22475_c0_seq2:54-8708(+)
MSASESGKDQVLADPASGAPASELDDSQPVQTTEEDEDDIRSIRLCKMPPCVQRHVVLLEKYCKLLSVGKKALHVPADDPEQQETICLTARLVESEAELLEEALKLERPSSEHMFRQRIKQARAAAGKESWAEAYDIAKELRKELVSFVIQRALFLAGKTETAAERIADKCVVWVNGLSGAGKSTTLHFICGSKLDRLHDDKWHVVEVVHPDLEFVKIGLEMKSETRYVTAIRMTDDLGKEYFIIDTPGFGDTRGPELDLANAVGVVRALHSAKSVRVLSLIEYSTLSKAMHVMKHISSLTAIIQDCANTCRDVRFLFTKLSETKQDRARLEEMLKSRLAAAKDEQWSGEEIRVLEHLVRICKTPRSSSIGDLANPAEYVISDMLEATELENPRDYFKMQVPPESQTAVESQLVKHRDSIRALLSLVGGDDKGNFELILFLLQELEALGTLVEGTTNGKIHQSVKECAGMCHELLCKIYEDSVAKLDRCLQDDNTLLKTDLSNFVAVQQRAVAAEPLRCSFLSKHHENTVPPSTYATWLRGKLMELVRGLDLASVEDLEKRLQKIKLVCSEPCICFCNQPGDKGCELASAALLSVQVKRIAPHQQDEHKQDDQEEQQQQPSCAEQTIVPQTLQKLSELFEALAAKTKLHAKSLNISELTGGLRTMRLCLDRIAAFLPSDAANLFQQCVQALQAAAEDQRQLVSRILASGDHFSRQQVFGAKEPLQLLHDLSIHPELGKLVPGKVLEECWTQAVAAVVDSFMQRCEKLQSVLRLKDTTRLAELGECYQDLILLREELPCCNAETSNPFYDTRSAIQATVIELAAHLVSQCEGIVNGKGTLLQPTTLMNGIRALRSATWLDQVQPGLASSTVADIRDDLRAHIHQVKLQLQRTVVYFSTRRESDEGDLSPKQIDELLCHVESLQDLVPQFDDNDLKAMCTAAQETIQSQLDDHKGELHALLDEVEAMVALQNSGENRSGNNTPGQDPGRKLRNPESYTLRFDRIQAMLENLKRYHGFVSSAMKDTRKWGSVLDQLLQQYSTLIFTSMESCLQIIKIPSRNSAVVSAIECSAAAAAGANDEEYDQDDMEEERVCSAVSTLKRRLKELVRIAVQCPTKHEELFSEREQDIQEGLRGMLSKYNNLLSEIQQGRCSLDLVQLQRRLQALQGLDEPLKLLSGANFLSLAQRAEKIINSGFEQNLKECLDMVRAAGFPPLPILVEKLDALSPRDLQRVKLTLQNTQCDRLKLEVLVQVETLGFDLGDKLSPTLQQVCDSLAEVAHFLLGLKDHDKLASVASAIEREKMHVSKVLELRLGEIKILATTAARALNLGVLHVAVRALHVNVVRMPEDLAAATKKDLEQLEKERVASIDSAIQRALRGKLHEFSFNSPRELAERLDQYDKPKHQVLISGLNKRLNDALAHCGQAALFGQRRRRRHMNSDSDDQTDVDKGVTLDVIQSALPHLPRELEQDVRLRLEELLSAQEAMCTESTQIVMEACSKYDAEKVMTVFEQALNEANDFGEGELKSLPAEFPPVRAARAGLDSAWLVIISSVKGGQLLSANCLEFVYLITKLAKSVAPSLLQHHETQERIAKEELQALFLHLKTALKLGEVDNSSPLVKRLSSMVALLNGLRGNPQLEGVSFVKVLRDELTGYCRSAIDFFAETGAALQLLLHSEPTPFGPPVCPDPFKLERQLDVLNGQDQLVQSVRMAAAVSDLKVENQQLADLPSYKDAVTQCSSLLEQSVAFLKRIDLRNPHTTQRDKDRKEFFRFVDAHLRSLQNAMKLQKHLQIDPQAASACLESLKEKGTVLSKEAESALDGEDWRRFNVHLAILQELNMTVSGVDLEFYVTKLKDFVKQRASLALDDCNKHIRDPERFVPPLLRLKLMASAVLVCQQELLRSIDELLQQFKKVNGATNVVTLGRHLETSGKSEGKDLVADHTVFQGVRISDFNTRTQYMDVKNVLKFVEQRGTTRIGHEKLLKNFEEFSNKYSALSGQYLQPRKPDERQQDFRRLVNEITGRVGRHGQSNPNTMEWTIGMRALVPELAAYIFMLWTLENSNSYFEMIDSTERGTYLMKPHAAQVISIFRLFSLDSEDIQIENHLVEIGTGEGKSITIAVTAIILALFGFEVSAACYSEYLSQRDRAAFDGIINILGVGEAVHYGTFNQLCEQIINAEGQVRTAVEEVITRGAAPTKKMRKLRPRFLIVDEVDVFFQREFYGGVYSIVATLQHPAITDLVQHIWTHRQVHTSLSALTGSAPYNALCAVYPRWNNLLLEAAKKMLVDVKSYTSHTYVLHNGRIGYKEQDTVSTRVRYGYKTLFAYYHEHELNNISDQILAENTYISLNCGHFSYAETPFNFCRMVGVSGTLRDLTSNELAVIEGTYRVNNFTYMPSVYRREGETERNLKIQAIFIAQADKFYEAIVKDIEEARKSYQRPCLVFFESREKLLEFHHSPQCPAGAQVLDEGLSATEKTAAIRLATQPGMISLLTRDYGRGTDFQVRSDEIVQNGGAHVLQTFLSEEKSEETQVKGRTARQGDSGSYSLILCLPDLEKFGIVSKSKDWTDFIAGFDVCNMFRQWQASRRGGQSATFESLNKARNDFFAAKQTDNGALIQELKTVHVASSRFVKCLFGGDLDAVDKFLLEQNHTVLVESVCCRTYVLMDATGSMAHLIQKSKTAVERMFSRLKEILVEKKLNPDVLEIKFVCYRNYNSSAAEILEESPWEADPANLRHFLEGIDVKGGWGNEAVEVGLWHAFEESEKGKINQIILIGDAPPNTEAEVAQKRRGKKWKGTPYENPVFYRTELQKLNTKEIPIHAFYVDHYAKAAFQEISSAGPVKGRCEFLNINSGSGGEQLTAVMTEEVLRIVGGDDLGAELVQAYKDKYAKAHS